MFTCAHRLSIDRLEQNSAKGRALPGSHYYVIFSFDPCLGVKHTMTERPGRIYFNLGSLSVTWMTVYHQLDQPSPEGMSRRQIKPDCPQKRKDISRTK